MSFDKNSSISILNIQEEERHRISRDLHDTSLQNLTHLVHKIELSSMYIDSDPLRAKLELSVVSKNLREIIEEIRDTIFNLRPMEFDDLGLKTAFERLLHRINVDNIYNIDYDIEDVSCENNIVLLTLYRVVQECLNNVVKHSGATKIGFKGRRMGNSYYIIIEDNGKGFTDEEVAEKQNNHFGLSLMQERIHILNGKIDFKSELGKGTVVEIEVPVDEHSIIR